MLVADAAVGDQLPQPMMTAVPAVIVMTMTIIVIMEAVVEQRLRAVL